MNQPFPTPLRLMIHRHYLAPVVTAVESIGMIAAQDAINAALGVVRGAVNKALGIAFF